MFAVLTSALSACGKCNEQTGSLQAEMVEADVALDAGITPIIPISEARETAIRQTDHRYNYNHLRLRLIRRRRATSDEISNIQLGSNIAIHKCKQGDVDYNEQYLRFENVLLFG